MPLSAKAGYQVVGNTEPRVRYDGSHVVNEHADAIRRWMEDTYTFLECERLLNLRVKIYAGPAMRSGSNIDT